jgi:uncharacterized protein YpuA (DUF1002 family)
METQKDKIIKQKVDLAEEVLNLAEQTLKEINLNISGAQLRDLVNVFTSAVKVHRDLMQDISNIEEKDSKSEQALSKEYTSKVDELLKKISSKES